MNTDPSAVLTDRHGNVIERRTIAADLMTSHARDVDHIDVWAHIGQAYDIDVVETGIDASVADEVIDLIRKAGIDLLWPDGTTNTELDAARVEIERLKEELARMQDKGYVHGLATAARWAAAFDQDLPKFDRATCQQMAKGLAAMVESAQDRLGVQANTQEPCDICSGHGCPDCRDDLSGITAATGTPREWSVAAEPDIDAVRDRFGRPWVRSTYSAGPSLWWQEMRGTGRPVTWHTLLGDFGPLTEAAPAQAVNA